MIVGLIVLLLGSANAIYRHAPRQTGAWRKRQELGEYLPSVLLEDVRQSSPP